MSRVELFETAGHLDADWQPLLTCVARITRLSWCKDTRSGLWRAREEVAYYACQICLSAADLGRAVRAHWGIEQDHRRIKRLVRPGLGFGGVHTARRTLAGYEVMAMIRKGQLRQVGGRDMRAQAAFIASLFGVAA